MIDATYVKRHMHASRAMPGNQGMEVSKKVVEDKGDAAKNSYTTEMHGSQRAEGPCLIADKNYDSTTIVDFAKKQEMQSAKKL